MVVTEQATALSTTRFSAPEADLLGEQVLRNRYALCISIYKRARNNPSSRKKKRPVTLGVPARLDGRYIESVFSDCGT